MSYVLDERLSMLTPYQPIQGNYRIRLDANESFIPLSDSVKEKLKISLDNLDFNRYPDPYAKDLIEAYGKVISTSPKNLVAGNGSDELIGLICGAFLADNAKVVTLTPDFSMYSFYTNIRKAYTYPFPRSNDFLPDADKLIKYINDTLPTILIFSNPNNPTGAAIEVDTVEKIIKSVSCL
ncbi:MAG: aminotransferase class I/II-fold pyridoxal phosphate-dependent enzyme, partial [Clostridia bacterium]